MPRTLFDQELERLGRDLSAMGRLVDKIMQGTIKCLKTMDIGLARTIFPRDAEINSMEKNIEQNCMNLLALQQPLAGDLRIITSTLKIITDMERISDQCADICEILSTVPRIASLTPSSQMLKMFEKAREMTAGALDAYIRRDAEAARAVCLADDEIDSLFSSAVLELCGRIGSHPSAVPENVDFMFIAKYIERMGDHATNIAEWAIFVQTGVHPNLNDTAAPEE
ncbi:MAG: phosphate signaling complex protein PhoU [Clostridiales bacterium]|jgi:phosphate transport system protein|nr:phosphate signaling complex protein PhoU [Clostridiales bacterium]